MKAIIGILFTLSGFVFVSANAAAQGTHEIYSERPFMCAAVFRILMEGHLKPEEKEEYDRYKTRFDALYESGKRNVLRNGGTDDDVRTITQKYIDTAGKFAVNKKDKIGDLILYCERMYRNM
ncbi:hypothetical protein I6F11_29635 [Ensifer sp. NBAIM29]|nr:hypothetical protein [Ensifer sp. NBAIM29]